MIMLSISAVLIVKNEAVRLDACLRSVKEAVDEIVVVDTGSTDETLEVAKGHTPNCFHFMWGGDFAAARNFGLARATGAYVLSIDADERIENPGEARALLLDFMARNGEATVGTVEIVNVMGIEGASPEVIDHTERFFRRAGARFEGAIHEQIVLAQGGKQRAATGVRLRHYGYAQRPDAPDHKARRNIPILEKEIAAYPEDEYFWYQLGKAHASIDQPLAAIAAFETALRHIRFAPGTAPSGRLGEVSRKVLTDLVVSLAYAYVNTARVQDAAELLERHAEMNHPGCRRADFAHARGYVFLMLGEIARSRAAYMDSLEFGPEGEDVRGTGSFSSAYHLALLCEAERDLGGAFGWLLRSLEQKPDYAPALTRCVDMAVEYQVAIPRELWAAAAREAFTAVYSARVTAHLEAGQSEKASLLIEAARPLSPELLAACRTALAGLLTHDGEK